VLQGELLRLWGEQRNLVVFVTHDIDEAVRLSDRVMVMTGRPGTIRDTIEIPMDRPRDLTSRDPAEVSEIKWRIWKQLEDEVRASLAITR
jgi:NitT/TauT family transport system ATP-binding protein